MIAIYYKHGKRLKSDHYIKKVKVNKKYGYFEITQQINHYEILFVKRFIEIDKIELYNHINDKKPQQVFTPEGD